MVELPDCPTDPVLARKLERIARPVGVAIALGDSAGCIEWVNAAFQRLTGYTAAEMNGKRLDLLRGLDIGEPALDYVMTRFRRGESSRLEIPSRREPGRGELWLDIEVQPLGPDEGFVALVSDVTERKLAQRRSQARTRDEETRRRPDPSPRPGPSAVPRLRLQPVDLSGLVIQNYDLLEAAVSGRTLLDLDLDGHLPRVPADAVRIREVLVGLVRQAADALAGAPGRIRVRTSPCREDPASGGVELEVRDTGWGVGRDRLATAGSCSRGVRRSLGLAEIRSIVEAHGGRLTLTTEPGRGTRAVVALAGAEGP